MSLDNKVAIVTGGAKGIGAAIVKQLAQAGARVIVADVAESTGLYANQLSSAGLQVAYIKTDVTRSSDVELAMEYAHRQYGGLDILVNNAGIYPRGTLLETTEELWDKIMNVNLKGMFFCCKAAVPRMIERGSGVIINIGSLNAACGTPNLFAYSASKGGAATITLNLAKALAEHKIRVNTVNPGWVATEGELEVQNAQQNAEEWKQQAGKSVPFGRLQLPDDIASAVFFLASDHASHITGQILSVDGGFNLMR